MEDNTFTFGVYLSCCRGFDVPQTQTLCQLILPLMWKVTLSLNWTLRTSRCHFQCYICSPCRILTSHQIFLSFSISTGRNLCLFTNKSLHLIFEVFILGSYNSSFGRRNNFCRPRLKHPDHWPKVPQKHKTDQDSCLFTCTFSVECISKAQTTIRWVVSCETLCEMHVEHLLLILSWPSAEDTSSFCLGYPLSKLVASSGSDVEEHSSGSFQTNFKSFSIGCYVQFYIRHLCC